MFMNTKRHKLTWQSGSTAVELAFVLIPFLMFLFGVIELARAIFVLNTLQEVTRRAASAAAHVDFQDETAKSAVRQNALFRTTAGQLIMGDPVTDQHIRIDYLALVRTAGGSMTLTPIPTSSMPSCPARNRLTCMANPHDASCIRFVRVRVCDPAASGVCTPVRYNAMLSLISLPLDLPISTTIASAESLGHESGMTPCP